MSADTPAAVLSAAAINGQSFASRATCLTRSERALYRRILESFIAGAPSPLDPTADAAACLIEADLIQTDGGGRVTIAYPFSAQPSRHRVTLDDGRDHYAMCAFDALGIPYMLHERGEVIAREPDGQSVARVAVDPHAETTWTPARAVAAAASGEGCCLAQSACPHINLFASPNAAARYLRARALDGGALSIADDAAAGRWLFGDLLDGLADAETVGRWSARTTRPLHPV